MSSPNPSNSVEDKLHAATRTPLPRSEFLAGLRGRLAQQPPHPLSFRQRLSLHYRRPAWTVLIVALLLLATGLAAGGPQRVFAAVRQLLGYIPGVGVVDQSVQIRVLAEPVSLTRDGVTVSVNRATLTADRTQFDFGVSGVPLSAYPPGETVSDCVEREYLRLPNGTQLAVDAPIPADVSQATFVLPCIFNTLPGTVPQDWELSVRFVGAPPDLVVMPIVELTSILQPAATSTVGATREPAAVEGGETSPPPKVQAPLVMVEKVIETDDGYILIGAVRLQTPGPSWAQVTSGPVIRDASGQKVAFTWPQDINEYELLDLQSGDVPFSFQVKATGLAFPLTIEMPGIIISSGDAQATAEVTFEAGPNPQAGQEWILNQEVQIAGYTLTLISITARSGNGYSFEFRTEPQVYSVGVEIEGHTAVGGGGGSNRQGRFQTSISYAEIPTGTLKVILSNLAVASETQIWRGLWQPEAARSDWPTPTAALYPVCLNAESFDQLPPLPAGLDGRALLTELNPEQRIVLVDLDNGQRQVIVPHGSRGTLSPDGQRLAYPASDGITIVDLVAGESTALKSVVGHDLHWSPDGTRIAYVTAGAAYGVFVAGLDGANPRQLSNLGYETIAGWSPDGKQLYYAIPDAGNDGFFLRAVDVASGEVGDLFGLPNSSRKAPMPAVSPDGNWIAYRGADNGSLYIIRIDGTQGRLVIEQPSLEYAITGIVWGPVGSLLGISMITLGTGDGEVILLQLEACEAYRITTLHGELDGLLIP